MSEEKRRESYEWLFGEEKGKMGKKKTVWARVRTGDL